jgi:large subunit ribosomal protein L21
MNFAVIKTGGKQYKVEVGSKIRIEKINGNENDAVSFDNVLLKVENDNVKIGTPTLKDEKVEGKILKQGREKKKIVFKYHSKTRYRKKKGHRQHYTLVEITKI